MMSSSKHLFPIGAAHVLLLLVISSGCRHHAAPPVTSGNDLPRWNWEVFPAVQRMRLAVLPCQLQPKSSISIYSPMVGVLRVYATEPQTNLPANCLWAEFEPTLFAAESKALAESKAKLEERERLQLELELPKEKLKMQKDLDEAQREVALLNLLRTNQDLARIALKLHSGANIKPEALANAQTELDLAQRSLHYLQVTNLAILGIDLPGQRSEWERRKLEFDRRQAEARLKMPFNGQLTINLPLTEGVEEYPVNSGQELAVARDLSLIRLRVGLDNPAWATLPPDRLMALVRLPNGRELTAQFEFKKIERLQAREEAVYYFQFPKDQAPMVARLMGTDLSCELWLNLPQPARVVPKLSLVLQQPTAFQGKTWNEGVRTAWPGASVLMEGQTDLAIVLANTAMNP